MSKSGLAAWKEWRVTPSKFWLKEAPWSTKSHNFSRLFGRVTPSRLLSKWQPNLKLLRLPGRVSCSRLSLKSLPTCQVSNSEDSVAEWSVSSWNWSQASISEGWLAKSHSSGSLTSGFQRLLGKITSQALIETAAQIQTTQTARKGNFFHILIEPVAKCQALKTAGQGHSFQALAKSIAKMSNVEGCLEGSLLPGFGRNDCQIPNSEDCLAGSTSHTPVERTQRQTLKIVWQAHTFKALVEVMVKRQAFKAVEKMVQIRCGLLCPLAVLPLLGQILPEVRNLAFELNTRRHADLLGHKCKTVLQPCPWCLAPTRFCEAPGVHQGDAM